MSLSIFNEFLGSLGNIITTASFIYVLIEIVRKKTSNKKDSNRSEINEYRKTTKVQSQKKGSGSHSSKLNSKSFDSEIAKNNIESENNEESFSEQSNSSKFHTPDTIKNSDKRNNRILLDDDSIAQYSIVLVISIASFILYSWTYNLIPTICSILLAVIIFDASKKSIRSSGNKRNFLIELFCYVAMILSLVNIPKEMKEVFIELTTLKFDKNISGWITQFLNIFWTNFFENGSISPTILISTTFRVAFSYLLIFVLIKKIWTVSKINEIDNSYTQPFSVSFFSLLIFIVGLNIHTIFNSLAPFLVSHYL